MGLGVGIWVALAMGSNPIAPARNSRLHSGRWLQSLQPPTCLSLEQMSTGAVDLDAHLLALLQG